MQINVTLVADPYGVGAHDSIARLNAVGGISGRPLTHGVNLLHLYDDAAMEQGSLVKRAQPNLKGRRSWVCQ
jgi:hypothetical protein